MTRRPDAGRTGLLLAVPGGLLLSALHGAHGSAGHAQLPAALVGLRDIAFAMPLLLAAALVALPAGRLLTRGAGLVGAEAMLARATTLATAAAAGLGATNALHAALFGGHDHGLAPVADSVRVALVAFVALLPFSMVVHGALPMAVTAARRLRTGLTRLPRRSRRLRRLALVVVTVTATLLAGTGTAAFAQGDDDDDEDTGTASPPASTIVVPSATDPGDPCPTDAPRKQFDVQAINVKIPVNRYGDNDPEGRMYALSSAVPAIRAQERSQRVSIGLRDDPIQPLVVRANLGDCVTFTYTNNASGGNLGMHIDGLSFTAGSSGDAIGKNHDSAPRGGSATTYTFYIPNDRTLEGAHYIHPGPGNRDAVDHGLFGALSVQPAGSTYRNPSTGQEQLSGWEADIHPAGRKAFREGVKLLHEIGNDNEGVSDAKGAEVDLQDDLTGSYRAGSFAMNYRSEPFSRRLTGHPKEKSHAYSSYTFGDPATPMPRGYVGDPTKFRVLHASGEKFHVYHLHGGGDRWRQNPHADTTYDYADTGLRKDPTANLSPSQRLDSQSMGPGEAYSMEIEGGAGGVQQSVGDFLYHCHIAKHYVSGMWSLWRVFNTLQADLMPLTDRVAPPQAVDSTGLLGRTMPDGTKINAANLDSWVKPQLPPQGVPRDDQDAAVWNYTVADGTYLGEPEDPTNAPDSISGQTDPAHPNRLPGDVIVGDRPKILFDPTTGRPAYPLLRTHIGKRPPFSPNGHSGAPYLGETANIPRPPAATNPWAGRVDGICPTGRKLRTFNVVAIETPVQRTKTETDLGGKIFVLAKNKDRVKSGEMPVEPLAIRSNQGDCDAITLTNEMTDAGAFDHWSKTSMHIHHVQFDVQGSDGVTAGFAFEHSVRPYKVEDPQLTAAAAAGSRTLQLSSTAKFHVGAAIAAGEGTDRIDINEITAINGDTLTLARPLAHGHAAGEWAGVEFVQYRWYPDVVLDNVFWHDHVDGIHGWGHGLVGQLIVEPAGSTYHDPKTGAEVDSGTLVDIHTTNPMAPGVVNGSFRELALWTINDNDENETSTLNLRAEPLIERDPATRFSSYAHGDPVTPLPKAYPKDPVVIRSINVSPTLDTLHVQGARFLTENRYVDAHGPQASLVDTVHHSISERNTLILDGGGGGPRGKPGDYLYFSGSQTRMEQGAWGLIRVLPGRTPELRPLPGNAAPAGTWTAPAAGPAPPTTGPGNPCPSGAPARSFQISAVDLKHGTVAYVPTADVAAVRDEKQKVEPLVLHVAAGECLTVDFRNDRDPDPLVPTNPQASFSVAKLDRDPASSGVNAGYSTEQNVAPGKSRRYVYYADSAKLGSATIADFGADSAKSGLYGAVVVAPKGAIFTDPASGALRDIGSQVDVRTPDGKAYRDFTLTFADDDFNLGRDFMGYVADAKKGKSLVNYAEGRPGDGADAFSSYGRDDPDTPVLRSYPGDAVHVHAVLAPGSEQGHVFSLGGLAWPTDPHIANSNKVTAQGFGPWETIDAVIADGGGGWAGRAKGATGDLFYGDLRRPFTVAGLWGYQRVLPPSSCALVRLDGQPCDAPWTPGGPAAPPAGSLAPTITGLSPDHGRVGTRVRISGANLRGTTRVTFGSTPAAFTVDPMGTVTTTVPPGATRGRIMVTTRTGAARSPGLFTVTPAWVPKPTVTAISAGTGKVGSKLVVTGSNLGFTTAVRLGATSARFVAVSNTRLVVIVPPGGTGRVAVRTPGGGAVSKQRFRLR